jgi:hypothetical protein
MEFSQLQKHLTQLGVVPCGPPITLKRLRLLVVTAAKWYGPGIAQCLMSFFMPTGKVIRPGIEDSYSHYLFTMDTWDELQTEWPYKAPIQKDNL